MKCRYCGKNGIGIVCTNGDGYKGKGYSGVCEDHKDKGDGLDS